MPTLYRRKEATLYGPEPGTAVFLWTRSLLTGHDSIDRQHQAIYTTLQGVANLLELPEVHIGYWLGMVVRALEEYVLTHFADEEQLMLDVGYPEYSQHALLHMQLTEDLKKHQAVIKRLTTQAEQFVEARSLLQFLNNWLNEHILEQDVRLVHFIHQKT
ncbi:MAG: hemerythrin domain-containing protein [Magnetococcus sp. MYC-9]